MAALCARSFYRCLSNRLNYALPAVHVRQYAIQPPEWLGGKIPKQILGPPLEEWQNFNEILEELNAEDTDIAESVNIGVDYKYTKPSHAKTLRQWRLNRSNVEFERAVRKQQFQLPMDEVKQGWLEEMGPIHQQTLARHYGIFRDLFNDAHFTPVVALDVLYDFGDDEVTPVYHGNRIEPAHAKLAPAVYFEAEADSLWTLIMTNPDGHLTDNESEYLHWFVGNIPAGDLAQGDVLCDYFPPFPPRGTGFHRHVFLLFKQTRKLDYDAERRPANCRSLSERTFSTVKFFRDRQSDLVPMGVVFFQSEWDKTVKDVYHNMLDMREPSFEYAYLPAYHPRPKRYPHREPFDRYYDRYRDKRELAEEVVRQKMKMTSPFSDYPERVYPLIHRGSSYKPSWLKRREELMIRRREQFQDLPY